jgi:hypothetical protein
VCSSYFSPSTDLGRWENYFFLLRSFQQNSGSCFEVGGLTQSGKTIPHVASFGLLKVVSRRRWNAGRSICVLRRALFFCRSADVSQLPHKHSPAIHVEHFAGNEAGVARA